MSSPSTPPVECPTTTSNSLDKKRQRRLIFGAAAAGLILLVVVAAVVLVVVWSLNRERSTVVGPDIAWGSINSPRNESVTAPYNLWSWNHGQYTGTTTTTTTTNADSGTVLKVLIIDNLPDKAHGSYGHSSSETTFALDTGYVWDEVGDGDLMPPAEDDANKNVIYNFTFVTWRNGTVVFHLNNVRYDLASKGSMFLIRAEPTSTNNTTGETMVVVVPIDVDLSGVVDDGHVQAFSRTNEDVIAFWEQ